MNSLLSIIDPNLDGNAWEDICVQCYLSKYQDCNYTHIPAISGGDAGIEGYTTTGIVHQCYYPGRNYSDNELYEALRKKLSADISKLLKNGDRLAELGVPQIREWHFNIPEYRDSRILVHATKKQKEVLKKKQENPAKYAYIHDDFRIIIKTADHFKVEISRIIRTSAKYNLNLAIDFSAPTKWEDCDSQKVHNIRRKIKAVMHIADDNNPRVNQVVRAYTDYYIRGLENMTKLRTHFPEIYADLYNLEQSYKNQVSITTTMNTDQTMNQSLFTSILSEFEQKLEKDFSGSFNQATIGEIKQDLVASWLADCSMEFWSDTNV